MVSMHESGCRFTLSNRLSRRWRFFCWRSTTTSARTTITTCWYDDGCCAIPGAALHQKKEDHKNPQSKRSDLLSLNAKYHPLQQTESVRKHFWSHPTIGHSERGMDKIPQAYRSNKWSQRPGSKTCSAMSLHHRDL